jgi:hypothetical protein
MSKLIITGIKKSLLGSILVVISYMILVGEAV